MRRFEDYLSEGIIKKMPQNKSKARDLFEESERKEASLKKIVKIIGISDENANDVVEYCYDIIMYSIRSKLYLEGLKSSGEGAHEAEISYLVEIGLSKFDVKLIDELRFFRNGIKYYGKRLNKEYAEKVISLMDKVLPFLRDLIRQSYLL